MADTISWMATIATIIAATMTASNLGSKITGYGFAVFLLGFVIIPMLKAIRNRNLLGGLMVGFLAISMFSETYMDRSMGCLLLGFFLSFVSAWRNKGVSPARRA